MNASPKLQQAARRFLLRLVAENGPEGAVRVLRDLADELEGLAGESAEISPYFAEVTTEVTTEH